MASALDGSVTLEDVFTVVAAKRVPLAPELAGYLILEIVDGADSAGGEIDPKSVFIGDEGTVALVRPKKDSAAAEDAETSARALLLRLLEASGSQTPALAATGRRRSGVGLRALGTEVESALIPVNRAAGRRALARLAREVKRVTQGVGRNASAPPPRREEPKPEPREESFEDEARTRSKADGPKNRPLPAPPAIRRASASLPRPVPPPAAPPPSSPPPAVSNEEGERDEGPPSPTPPPLDVTSGTPPPARGLPKVQAPKPRTLTPMPREGATSTARAPTGKRDSLFAGDEVDSLLATFEVSNIKDDKGVSRDLKELVGLDPTPPPPEAKDLAKLVESVVGKKAPVQSASEPLLPLDMPKQSLSTAEERPRSLADALEPESAHDGGVDELLGLGGDGEPTRGAPVDETRNLPQKAPGPSPAKPTAKRLPAVSRAAEPPRPAPTAPPESRAPAGASATNTPRLPEASFEPPRAPKTSFALAAMALVVLLAGVGAIYKFFPEFFSGKGKGSAAPSTSTSAPPVPKCKATVVATDVPQGAEVLWRVGQAPTDVERMPVGRLEFVATAEGHVPKRAVVPAGASWDTGGDGKPRFELAVQLDPAKKAGTVEPWPPGEPGATVGGNGAPGTVHLVTTPRGAEVWLLVGLGPEARVERLKCDAEVDVLVAGPGTFRKRLHATPDDIAKAPLDENQTRVIKLSAK
jgi:hypothetical protein